MAESKYWLPKFDPAADFIVAAWPQGFTVNGHQPKSGAPFDKTSVSPRMLEEHYVKRWIAVAEAEHITLLPAHPSPVAAGAPAHLSKKQRKKLRQRAAA